MIVKEVEADSGETITILIAETEEDLEEIERREEEGTIDTVTKFSEQGDELPDLEEETKELTQEEIEESDVFVTS